MPLNTISATITIAPVVIQTFFGHYRNKVRQKSNEDDEHPSDWILFDEAFHIVKAFIMLGTRNTIESLQSFTNTHVPHPYWATVIPVQVPLSSCNQAADVLKSWFSEDELRDIVGGERWWQVRGLDGIEAEWVAMDDDVDAKKPEAVQSTKQKGQRMKEQKAKLKKGIWVEEDMVGMDKLERVMMYIHGGGYFWGSINTHRYQIIRFARKMAGRCFAVNYRKAPQYPWPCPLHDVLAAYLYLIRPPKGAPHSAIDPRRIVLAGDSAGGGLAITCLTILRDLGLPMPAGAVLVSPWVDLTHSFPSVLTNTESDIIPPHGFIHKPSTLWPVPAILKARAVPTNPVPTNTGHTTQDRSKAHSDPAMKEARTDTEGRSLIDDAENVLSAGKVSSNNRKNTDDGAPSSGANSEGETLHNWASGGHAEVKPEVEAFPSKRNTKSIKVAMSSPDRPVLELRSQIQQYATNEQLTHPLVSPVLQGSLGGLCPLYIMAGDSELLRDEIIYLAHRAGNPREYPIRKELLEGPRQAENAQKYMTPTRVRLQVFDGMCHVGPTVFSFTHQSTYAYRAIAEFVKHVTSHSAEELTERPFPQTTTPDKASMRCDDPDLQVTHVPSPVTPPTPEVCPINEEPAVLCTSSQTNLQANGNMKIQDETLLIEDQAMVRERIDVHGRPRPMEPSSEVEALRVPHDEVGLIKEAPVKRWLAGQEKWDAKYKRSAERAERKRKKLEQVAEKLMRHLNERRQEQNEPPINSGDTAENIEAQEENARRWGPLDLVGDNPPPSAIAGRRDTPDALALLKIYFAPPDSPALRRADALSAAIGRRDAPVQPYRQSPAEQQVKKRIIPVHGLSMWSNLMSYFLKKSSQKTSLKTQSFGSGSTPGSD